MSLDTVVEDIREEARTEAEEIREAAQAEAEEIREAARADADSIISDAEAAVEQAIEQERDQKLSSANLEAKQERLALRRDLLQSVRADVEAAVADISGSQRRELTDALLEAAAREFDDADTTDAEVYGRADDEELLADLCDSYEGFAVAGETDCLGGVVVESESARVRVNNTFDSVLEEVWEAELKAISDRLFDQ